MKKLSKDQVLMLHAELLRETGGAEGLRDEGLLDSALNAPFQSFGETDVFPSLQQKGARLGYGLICNHAFVDGNKRIGTHVMLVFLALNGIELEYTQEQIKPHFFLNCLSLIHGIADKNNEGEIVEITTVLSDYMRYIFQDSKKQRDVEEELEHIEAYIRIQKLRYGEEAFSFEATTDGDIGEWKVPSLLLQTLVENSVVHGVSLDRKSEISLYLTNETYEDGEYLYICISDTGNGFSKEALDAIENDTPIIYHGRHHVGISNIKRRLALMYGERASITCSNMDENYGAVVEVRLPKTE